jgi:hypothetical protein
MCFNTLEFFSGGLVARPRDEAEERLRRLIEEDDVELVGLRRLRPLEVAIRSSYCDSGSHRRMPSSSRSQCCLPVAPPVDGVVRDRDRLGFDRERVLGLDRGLGLDRDRERDFLRYIFGFEKKVFVFIYKDSDISQQLFLCHQIKIKHFKVVGCG